VAGPTAADLFERHHRDVHRYLARMTGRPDIADDLSQEVFLRVVRALRNGGPPGHERGWVFAIAHHLLIDRIRQLRRQPPLEARGFDAGSGEIPAEAARPATQGLAIDVSRAIERLPEADREAFLLREVGGLHYDEIAATCECTIESVRSRLHRARAALRTMLSDSR